MSVDLDPGKRTLTCGLYCVKIPISKEFPLWGLTKTSSFSPSIFLYLMSGKRIGSQKYTHENSNSDVADCSFSWLSLTSTTWAERHESLICGPNAIVHHSLSVLRLPNQSAGLFILQAWQISKKIHYSPLLRVFISQVTPVSERANNESSIDIVGSWN